MSYEQYSPLDTTLPYFSTQIRNVASKSRDDFILPFLLKYKAIARKIRISLETVQGSDDYINVYFNYDRENPVRFGNGSSVIIRDFEKWITHLRIVSESSTTHYYTVESDLVPVQYLPPKTRV